MTAHGYPENEIESCPAREMLEQFVQLALAPECNRVVRRHIEHCECCQEALDKLTGSPWISSPRDLPPSVVFDASCQRLVERLCGDTSQANGSTQTHPSPIRLSKSPSESLGALAHYHIRRELASGATATVFEAVDTKTNQLVAIKFIRDGDANTLRRVQREARAIGQIQHDSVVSIQSAEFADDGRMFLVMPLVPGRPLSEIIRDQTQQPPEQVAKIIQQIADGLVEVHRQGVLHRDVKPSNIMVDATGAARLTDFGLAEFVHEESTLTETGAVVGSPSYMSPEQAGGKRELDQRTDVYSLGVTLYECLTDTRAFRGSTADVIRQVLNDEPLAPRTINPRVPRDLELICLKAMAKEPGRRYASAMEFRDDLARWLEGKPILARPMGRVERVVLWSRRNPQLAAISAALLLSVVSGATGVWWNWRAALRQRDEARENLRQAMRAVDTFYSKVSLPSSSLDQPGLQPLRRELLQEALKAYEEFLSKWPDDPYLREEAALAACNLAGIVDIVGGSDEKIAAWNRAIAAIEAVESERAADVKWREKLCGAHFHRASAYMSLNRFSEAVESLSNAQSILEPLAAEFPMLIKYRRDLASCSGSLGNCEMLQNHYDSAQAHYLKAGEVYRQLLSEDSGNADVRNKLAITLTNLAMASPSDQRPSMYNEARELLLAISPMPLSAVQARRVAKINYSEGCTYKELGRAAEALADFNSGIELMRPHVEANPAVADYRWMLGTLYFESAMMLGPTEAGISRMDLAKEHRELIYRSDPNSVTHKDDMCSAIANSVAFRERMNMRDAALKLIAGIADLPHAAAISEQVAKQLSASQPPISGDVLEQLTQSAP